MEANNNQLEEQHVCAYCGKEAKYQLKNGRWCCHQFSTKCPVNKQKNSKGLKNAYDTGKLDAKLIYQNKSQQAKQNMAWNKGLTKQTSQSVRKRRIVITLEILVWLDNSSMDRQKTYTGLER